MSEPHILIITFGQFCTITLVTTSAALIIALCVIALVVLIIFVIGAVMTANRDKEEEKRENKTHDELFMYGFKSAYELSSLELVSNGPKQCK